jgi:hypothetical protein
MNDGSFVCYDLMIGILISFHTKIDSKDDGGKIGQKTLSRFYDLKCHLISQYYMWNVT